MLALEEQRAQWTRAGGPAGRAARLACAAAAVALTAVAAVVAPAPPRAPAAAQEEAIEGIDVSRFQGRVKWRQVASSEVQFAFVQASRGSGRDCLVAPERCGPDEQFVRNRARAAAAGIAVGAYHRAFAGGEGRPGVKRDARREARLFLAQVQALHPEELLPALDVETPFGGLDQRELRIWVRTWLAKAERALGVKPILYTNRSSWRATGDTTSFARRGHRLWVANFDVDAPAVPAANWNGLGWSIWQYTSSGQVKGIEGAVDRNVLAVALEEISVSLAAAR